MSDEEIQANVENAKILSFEEIAAADDIDVQSVFIKEWGGTVKVKVFTKAEQQEIRRKVSGGGEVDSDEFERQVIITGMAEPTISDAQYNLLLNKSANAVQELANAIMKINGLSGDTEETEEKSFR